MEGEIALLRDSINNLILTNRDLNQEVHELNSDVSLVNIHFDRTPTRSDGEEEKVQDQAIEAQPVNIIEERPLQVGDHIHIVSRQQFGIEGVVHSFTNQFV